ncbi:hypothetical protein EMCRGX_G009346 [Ephydatia muelleri]
MFGSLRAKTVSEQRNWPRDVLESKDGKNAKRAYRQKCEGFITEDDLLFKSKRRKKGLTSVQEEERYRVVTVDEKVRLLDTVHKDPAGGHFGVHKTQEKVAERYYWKGMASDIANYCSTCLALSNMLSVTFCLVTNSSVDEQSMVWINPFSTGEMLVDSPVLILGCEMEFRFHSLSQIQPTNLHSHEQTKQPSDQTLKYYTSSNSFNEVKSDSHFGTKMINAGTQHFVMKFDFQQLLNGECIGDNIINFFFHMLEIEDRALNDTSGKCIRCLNSFVFTMLSEENGYSLHRISSLFEVIEAMLSLFHATSCCKSNHDKDLSEHLMILGSFHFTRILASNKTTSMTVVFLFASLVIVYNSSETVKTYKYKSLLPKFNTPLPEEISPVDPLPERCFYEKHAKNLKLWKKPLPAFIDRDQHLYF